MRTSVVAGLVLAVLAGALAAISGPLTLESVWPLFLAAGVMLVPGGGLIGRLAAYAVGVAAAWGAFALRAGVLPDIPMGRAVFAVTPVLIVLVVAVLSGGRAPLWSGLAGAAAFGATYHQIFAASPTEFAATSIATLTAVLLASGIGAAAALLLRPGAWVGGQEADVVPIPPEPERAQRDPQKADVAGEASPEASS